MRWRTVLQRIEQETKLLLRLFLINLLFILALELLVTLAFVAVVRVLILFLELLYVGEGSSALLALAVGCDTWKECRSEIP